MRSIPPGEARYLAWIPERGLSGTGVLTVTPPPGDVNLPGRSFEGNAILHPVLRETGTAGGARQGDGRAALRSSEGSLLPLRKAQEDLLFHVS